MAEIPTNVLSGFVKNLSIGINISRMYPSGHPSLDATLGRIYDIIQEIFTYTDEFSIYVLENIIFIENEKFDIKTIPAINAMLQSFHKLGVRSVTFKEDLDVNEMKSFLSVMGVSREELEDYGDIELLIKDHAVDSIAVNEVEYGIVKGSVSQEKKVNIEDLLKSLSSSMTEDESVKFLSEIVGINKDDNEISQSRKVFKALERLSKMIIDRYGEGNWGEYSLILAKALESLSPSVKSQLAQVKTENERLAGTIREVITTMSDDDLVDVISRRAAGESELPADVVAILKKLTGPRLTEVMPRLEKTLPEEFFKELSEKLEMGTGKAEKKKKREKGLEGKMRSFYAMLRDKDKKKRRQGIEGISKVIIDLINDEKMDIARMGINRLSATSDAESDEINFHKILEKLVEIAQLKESEPLYGLISKILIRHASRIGDEFVPRRKVAINMVGKLKDPDHISVLFSALWEAGLFNETRDALLNYGSKMVEPLFEYLGDVEDRGVRMKIIDVLKRLNREDIMPILRKLLDDDRWFVRRNIVTLLGEFRDHESVEAIGFCLDDQAHQVREEAVDSLARIGGEKVAELLCKILDQEVDIAFLKATTYLPSKMVNKALPKLLPLLKRKKTLPDKKEETRRSLVIKAIANIGDHQAIEPLTKVVKESPLFKGGLLIDNKRLALDALFKIGGADAIRDFANSRNEIISAHVQRLLKSKK